MGQTHTFTLSSHINIIFPLCSHSNRVNVHQVSFLQHFYWFILICPDSMPPSNSMTNQTAPYGSYGYPNMQPAYRQGPPSQTDSSPSHDPYSQSSYNQYSQVSVVIDVYVYLPGPKSLMWTEFKPVFDFYEGQQWFHIVYFFNKMTILSF